MMTLKKKVVTPVDVKSSSVRKKLTTLEVFFGENKENQNQNWIICWKITLKHLKTFRPSDLRVHL